MGEVMVECMCSTSGNIGKLEAGRQGGMLHMLHIHKFIENHAISMHTKKMCTYNRCGYLASS